jgi:predicted MFS family arabinose efflux permease
MTGEDAIMKDDRDVPHLSLGAKIVLLGSSIPGAMALSTLSPVLPKMEADLSHTDIDQILVKMVIGIVGIGVMLGAPIAGYMGDRMNRPRIMTWAFAVFAVVGASGYFIENLWLMVATRFIMAWAGATALTIGFAMAGDIKDEAVRRHYMGLAVSIASFTALLTVALGGALGDKGWRLTFLVFLFPLPLSLFAYLQSQTSKSKPHGQDSGTTKKIPFRLPLGLMLLALGGGILQYIPLTYLAFYMRSLNITSSTTVGMALVALAVPITISSSLFGAVRARVSSTAAFGMTFALIGFGGAGIALSQNFTGVAASLFIMGVGSGWFIPNLVVSTTEAADVSTRARSVGLVKAANMSATFVCIAIAEPIMRIGGIGAVFMAMAAAAFMISVFFIRLTRAQRRDIAHL